MPSYAVPALWGLAAYLLGSITWGYLVARLYGVSIRTVGTRNPGAANVFRTVGRLPGIAVFVADVMTGAAALLPAGWLPHPDITRLVAAVMVLVGTFFPLFTRFQGGTGLAKGMGAAMGINPAGFFVGAPVGILLLVRFRNSALAGGTVIVISGLFSILVYRDLAGAGIMALVGLLVFLRARFQYADLEKSP